MCYNEIGLCAQNINTIVGSILNIIGGLCDNHSKRMRILTLTS